MYTAPPPTPPERMRGDERGAALGRGAERKARPPTRPPDLAAQDSSGSAVEDKSTPHAAATSTFCTTSGMVFLWVVWVWLVWPPPWTRSASFPSLLARGGAHLLAHLVPEAALTTVTFLLIIVVVVVVAISAVRSPGSQDKIMGSSFRFFLRRFSSQVFRAWVPSQTVTGGWGRGARSVSSRLQ